MSPGFHVPAFVERATGYTRPANRRGVAGIHVPAFVERLRVRGQTATLPCVSPGFTSRPSLSGQGYKVFHTVLAKCRRDSRPGLR